MPADAEWASSVVASIWGHLAAAGGTDTPESGLHWAAAVLTTGGRKQLVVASSDASWFPQGVRIPRDADLLWDRPEAERWAYVDDPVRPLLEEAKLLNADITAIATTHPSRAYLKNVGAESFLAVTDPGKKLGGADRFELTVSPERVAYMRSLSGNDAADQCASLAADAQAHLTPAGMLLPGAHHLRAEALRFLESRVTPPAELIEQLAHAAEDLVAADRDARMAAALAPPPGVEIPFDPEISRARLERAATETVIAAGRRDIESTTYAWTITRLRADVIGAQASALSA